MARTVGAYSSQAQAPGLQQAWQAMRVMRRFTSADILVTAAVGESALHKYLQLLGRTGYIRLAQPRVSGRPGSRHVWAMVRDTGPVAPIRRKDGTGVFDRNTCKVWPLLQEAEEVAS